MSTYTARDALLRELGYPDYHAYIRSELWAWIRARRWWELRWEAGASEEWEAGPGKAKCQLCHCYAKVLHHLSYGRRVLLGQDMRPLVPLCHRCHEKVEFSGSASKGTLVKRTLAGAQRQYSKLLKKKNRKSSSRKVWRRCSRCRACGRWRTRKPKSKCRCGY